MADLRAELGITQASLYAAFGSKEQLFREAVDLYRQTAGFSTTDALARGANAREAIHAMLQAAVNAFSAPDASGGCLLILGATNCVAENKAVRDHLLSIRRQISQSILDRLKQGQHNGDVRKQHLSSPWLRTTRQFFTASPFNQEMALRERRSRRSYRLPRQIGQRMIRRAN